MKNFIKVTSNGKTCLIKLSSGDMEKGKKAQIGETSIFGDGKTYKKVSDHRWEPINETGSHTHKDHGGGHSIHDEKKSESQGDITPSKLHEKFRVYMENMPTERRALFRGGKMNFEKKMFVSNDGKLALHYKDGKITIAKHEGMEKAYNERPGHKYYKRIMKPTGKGFYYFYNKDEYEQFKDSKYKPEKKSIWSGIMSFFNLKDENKAEEKVRSLHESNKEKLAGVSLKTFAQYLNEYITNKEKWDKKFSEKKSEKGESKGGGGEKKSSSDKKESGEKKSPTWNVKLMKTVAEIVGGVKGEGKRKTAEEGMKEAFDSIQELRDSLPSKQFEILQHVLNTYHDRGTNMAVTKKDVQNLDRLKNTGLVHITTYMNGDGSIGLTEKGKKFAGQVGYAYSKNMAEFSGKKSDDKTEITSPGTIKITPEQKESLFEQARKWGKLYESQMKSMSGTDVATAEKYRLERKAFADLGEGADLETILKKMEADWKDYAVKMNEKVDSAKKIQRGPKSGLSVIEHKSVSPGEIDGTIIFVRNMYKQITGKDKSPLKESTEKLAEAVGTGADNFETMQDYQSKMVLSIKKELKQANKEFEKIDKKDWKHNRELAIERAEIQDREYKLTEKLKDMDGSRGRDKIRNEYRKIVEKKDTLSVEDQREFPDLAADEIKKQTGLNFYHDEEINPGVRGITFYDNDLKEHYYVNNVYGEGQFSVEINGQTEYASRSMYGGTREKVFTPGTFVNFLKERKNEKTKQEKAIEPIYKKELKSKIYSDPNLKHKDGTYKTKIGFDAIRPKIKKLANADEYEKQVFEKLKVANILNAQNSIRPAFMYNLDAQKDGVWTDSRALIHDKKVTDEIYKINKQNLYLETHNAKKQPMAATASEEDRIKYVAEKQYNAGQFPNWQQIMPKEIPSKKAEFTGWYDPDPKKPMQKIEYSDGDTTVWANASFIASMKTLFPTATMHLTGKMSPIVFKVGNEVKALVMPIQRNDSHEGMVDIKNQDTIKIKPDEKMQKAAQLLLSELQKAKKAGMGETRTHKDGSKWKKVGEGKWEPVTEEKKDGSDKEKKSEKGKKKPDEKKPDEKKKDGEGKRGVMRDALKKVADILANALSMKETVDPAGQAIEKTGENEMDKNKGLKKPDVKKVKKPVIPNKQKPKKDI